METLRSSLLPEQGSVSAEAVIRASSHSSTRTTQAEPLGPRHLLSADKAVIDVEVKVGQSFIEGAELASRSVS